MTLAIAKTIGDIKMTEYETLVERYWQGAGRNWEFSEETCTSANGMQRNLEDSCKCLGRMQVLFDLRLASRSRWHLRSSAMLHSVQG